MIRLVVTNPGFDGEPSSIPFENMGISAKIAFALYTEAVRF